MPLHLATATLQPRNVLVTIGGSRCALTLAAHRRAQEIVGLMNLFGASLYGSTVGTDRRAAKRWFLRVASRSGTIPPPATV